MPGLDWVRSTRCKVFLPAADVDPLTEFESNAALDARKAEPKILVQRDARVIGQRNARDRSHEPLALKQLKMRFQQLPAKASTLERSLQIDSGFHAPAIG